jgi:DNA invertase Pin-like site-specific DNA recombinase
MGGARLVMNINDILEKIGFKSITENIDTTTSSGKLIFHIFGALAEFERDIIREQVSLLPEQEAGREACQRH